MSRQILDNIAWLFGERVALTLLVFVSNVYVIRYLGADRFGELALFQVYLALALTCTEFGLRRVFLALARTRAIRLVLAATVSLKTVIGILLAVLIAAAVVVLEARAEFLLLAAVVVLAPLEAYVYHFEAQLRNDLLARIRIGVALALAALRVGLCVAGAGVPALAATYVLPGVLLGLACRVLARRAGVPPPAAPDRRLRHAAVRAHVLRRSSFFFASTILVQLHARSDQLILSAFASTGELGIYAGAYKFVEQLLLLPAMVCGVLLPALSRRSEADTADSLEQVYFASFAIAIGLALALAFAAEPLVAVVLGPEFARSAAVLQILAWGIPAFFLANVSGLFYSLNGLEHWAFVRNLLGLALAAGLGMLLVPRHGAEGAAWATVASYTFVAFVAECWSPRFRRNLRLKGRAFAALFSAHHYGALLARMRGQGGPG